MKLNQLVLAGALVAAGCDMPANKVSDSKPASPCETAMANLQGKMDDAQDGMICPSNKRQLMVLTAQAKGVEEACGEKGKDTIESLSNIVKSAMIKNCN